MQKFREECKGCYIYESIKKSDGSQARCIIRELEFQCPCWNCLVKVTCDHYEGECPDMDRIKEYIIDWHKNKGLI